MQSTHETLPWTISHADRSNLTKTNAKRRAVITWTYAMSNETGKSWWTKQWNWREADKCEAYNIEAAIGWMWVY